MKFSELNKKQILWLYDSVTRRLSFLYDAGMEHTESCLIGEDLKKRLADKLKEVKS